jgi:hypothetical protein
MEASFSRSGEGRISGAGACPLTNTDVEDSVNVESGGEGVRLGELNNGSIGADDSGCCTGNLRRNDRCLSVGGVFVRISTADIKNQVNQLVNNEINGRCAHKAPLGDMF